MQLSFEAEVTSKRAREIVKVHKLNGNRNTEAVTNPGIEEEG